MVSGQGDDASLRSRRLETKVVGSIIITNRLQVMCVPLFSAGPANTKTSP